MAKADLIERRRREVELENKQYRIFQNDLRNCLGMNDAGTKRDPLFPKHVLTVCPDVDESPVQFSVWKMPQPYDQLWIVRLYHILSDETEDTFYFDRPQQVVDIINTCMRYFYKILPQDTQVPIELYHVTVEDLFTFAKQSRSYFLDQLD